jgi:GNAT superfamily N-acetyltransferase
MSSPSIRAAGSDESAVLQAIEVAAGRQFVEVGLADVAAHQPHPADELEAYGLRGRAWVAVDDEDRPVAFLLAGLVDGRAHVDEVSVHPTHARRAVGRALIDHVAAWAMARDLPGVTLTTFAEVPWNAPYYLRCGFHVLDDHVLGPDLAGLLRAEQTRYGALHPRVAMIRPL